MRFERKQHKDARTGDFFREMQKIGKDCGEKVLEILKPYLTWEVDDSRRKPKAWQQLNIWKLRKKHVSFEEIAEKFNIPADTAKHAFYTAYERTQNKKYDPDVMRKAFSKVDKTELEAVCASCPNKGNYPDCIATCPEALRYIDQDQRKLNWRETPLSELAPAKSGNDMSETDFLDHLQHKNTI